MRLHSRLGSIVLGLAGAGYFIVALTLLGWSIPAIGPFLSTRDYAILLLLVVAAGLGVWFVRIALESLNIRLTEHLPHVARTDAGPRTHTALR